MDADVAIVGFGPTGMTLAALLAQAGHRVIALERYAGLYNLPRAAAFDGETMRTLDKIGVAEQLVPTLSVRDHYEWRNAQRELLIDQPASRHGSNWWADWYQMYQPELETALNAACRALPSASVEFGCRVVDISQDEDEVNVETVTSPGVTQTFTARYVVACDGGNSTVRGRLDIESTDYGFAVPWLVCDFELRKPVNLPVAMQLGDPKGPTSIVALGPRHHRFSYMLDDAEQIEAASDVDWVWRRVAGYLTSSDAELIRVARYVFRSEIADRWRERRVLLAGDAAHQMPPFLGQGMCSGMRDAHNLAFKLDLVLADRLAPSVLDTYQREREPHVRAITAKAIELGRVQTIRDPAKAAERDRALILARNTGESAGEVRLPGLEDGLLSASHSPLRGKLSIQSEVADEEQRGRADDIIGRGFAFLATVEGYHALANTTAAASLRNCGVRLVGIASDTALAPAESIILDIQATYDAWFADHDAIAVVIRPDFYIYGSAQTLSEVHDLATELIADLGG